MGYKTERKQGFYLIRNTDGKELGMSELRLKEADGYAFKNLSGTAELLPYEDWRLPYETRAEDLAKRLSLEQIAGLMLWSPHQLVPFVPGLPFKGHYDGGDFVPGVTDPAALTDEQKKFVSEEHLRNFLLVTTESAETAARWNNRLQALAEASAYGVPVCISSDPRHAAGKKGAEFSGTGREVSRWPEGLGMAATFDVGLIKEFAKVIAKEYRALGITQALGPQIDLATEPRWMRLERESILERQREGIEIAKAEGKYKGRKPVAVNEAKFRAVCVRWRAGEMTATAAMQEVGLKPNTFYRRVREFGL